MKRIEYRITETKEGLLYDVRKRFGKWKRTYNYIGTISGTFTVDLFFKSEDDVIKHILDKCEYKKVELVQHPSIKITEHNCQ